MVAADQAASADAAGRTARDWVDDLGLAAVLVDSARRLGLDEGEAWRTVEGIRGLLTAPAWFAPGARGRAATAGSLVAAWLSDDAVGRFMQVNVYRDVRWFSKEAFQRFTAWNAILALAGHGMPASRTSRILATTRTLNELADRSGYRVDELLRIATSPPPKHAKRAT